jgi:hypothetical protein
MRATRINIDNSFHLLARTRGRKFGLGDERIAKLPNEVFLSSEPGT